VKSLHIVPLVVATLAAGTPARADPEAYNPNAYDLSGALDRDVAPTLGAFEIAVAGGYTQGVGGAGGAGSIEDVTGPGGTIEGQLGYRMTPRFSIGLYGTLARFRHGDAFGDGSRVYGATAGVQLVWHSRELRSLDPWISVGAGWRGLWLTPIDAPASSIHGIEIVRIQLGIDYRITPRLAVAPVVGASASLFLVENAAMPSDFTSVRDRRLNLYGFTGVLGRFDLGG